jgi:hypothetical protein
LGSSKQQLAQPKDSHPLLRQQPRKVSKCLNGSARWHSSVTAGLIMWNASQLQLLAVPASCVGQPGQQQQRQPNSYSQSSHHCPLAAACRLASRGRSGTGTKLAQQTYT